MKAFMKIFQTQLEAHFNIEQYIDCRNPPQKLLRQVKSNEGKKLIKLFDTQHTNIFKVIRSFSVAHLLIIYSKNWYELVETHLRYKPTKDEWLNNKFLEPYYRLIIKCCTSKQSYNETKSSSINKRQCFQMLFYTINILRLVFKVVQKMPLLGRYYKSKNNNVITSAVEIIALQAQKLYNTFKSYLLEILAHPQFYIKNKNDEEIMRGIFKDQLTIINEQMKKLFLDKYFYPFGKGIIVKLFKPEQQTKQCERTFNSIISNHEETQRQKRQDELETTLFPGSGVINWKFYEETLKSGELINKSIGQSSNFIDLNDLAISEQDEAVEDIQNGRQKKQQPSQKQTNTGTLQIKGHEM